MPSFDVLDKVEQLLRAGLYPVAASKSAKRSIRAASKKLLYKDGRLWRPYRGRLLQVVRSDEEIREIMSRYHDNNNHAGRGRTIKEIMLMYYWVGVTETVKTWIKACAVCQSANLVKTNEPPVHSCLAYGCDASSYLYPELSFHKFPKDAERRRRWLAVAQRDEGSLRSRTSLCSRHFEASCFSLNEEGQLTLSADAVPTIISVMAQEPETRLPSDENFLHSNSLDDLLSSAAAASQSAGTPDLVFDQTETPSELQEHQYCLPIPGQDPTLVQTVKLPKKKQFSTESCFVTYNLVARYLSHRILPMQSKSRRSSLKRMAKRFSLIDGVLMFTRVSPPLRVPRSREEVNAILQQFHDNQGHYSQGICQKQIGKHFYWSSMGQDLAHWISSCHTCLSKTKRKWLRCSVLNCTNCCGPVERGLGLTFHEFPLHNPAMMNKWVKAVGRSHWRPRLWSSVCSVHFTEDCFDRQGEKVTLHPDALPTLVVYSDSVTSSQGPAISAAGDEFEQAYFAKYDAVDLYLRKRTYPPGLNFVEKNTFRRFCKTFTIKDDELHMVKGERVRLVLRNRQQVEAALTDYHTELNHLDTKKCLRLLNERYFWKTMKSDVMKWINSCSLCSHKKTQKPDRPKEGRGSVMDEINDVSDSSSEREVDDFSPDEEDDVGDEDEVSETLCEEDFPLASNSEGIVPKIPVNPQAKIPILLHLKSPVNLEPKSPIILQPTSSNTRFLARIWNIKTATSPQSKFQKKTISSDPQPKTQESVQLLSQPKTQSQESSGSRGSARTHYVQVQVLSKTPTESYNQPEPAAEPGLTKTTTTEISPGGQSREIQPQSEGSAGANRRPKKRKSHYDGLSLAKRSSSCGLEPVKAPSSKPWPVFTISVPSPVPTVKDPPKVDRAQQPPIQRRRSLQARTIIQQVSQARVKVKPAMDGVDAQWAEIQEGMVVYVCFFHEATEDIPHQIATSLMTTRHFRKDAKPLVSILDLPGSVLFVPQDSLVGEPVPKRKIQYKRGCEQWWGAQLFSRLVSVCMELMASSVKCTEAGVKVEQGVYGQRQEIVVSSVEPKTILLEF